MLILTKSLMPTMGKSKIRRCQLWKSNWIWRLWGIIGGNGPSTEQIYFQENFIPYHPIITQTSETIIFKVHLEGSSSNNYSVLGVQLKYYSVQKSNSRAFEKVLGYLRAWMAIRLWGGQLHIGIFQTLLVGVRCNAIFFFLNYYYYYY